MEIHNNIKNIKPGEANSIYKYLSEKELDKDFYPFFSHHNWVFILLYFKKTRISFNSNKIQ